MFSIERTGPNRLDIELGGKIDSVEMECALDAFIDKSEGIENGLMMYRLGDFQIPTLGAIAIEFSRLPSLFRFIGKFQRAAIIADKKWIRKASEIEGALIPGLTIKSFTPGDEAAAEKWLGS